MTDPRIDPLSHSAILTNTQLRLTFAPADKDAKVQALKVEIAKAKIDQLDPMMAVGRVYLQIKAGFGIERSIELSPTECVLFYDALEKFIHELPRARQASDAQED